MPENKLGPDGLVEYPESLFIGGNSASHIASIDIAQQVWGKATKAQRDAMLAEIMAMTERHLTYKPPYDKRHVTDCPGCEVEEFKARIKERFGHVPS